MRAMKTVYKITQVVPKTRHQRKSYHPLNPDNAEFCDNLSVLFLGFILDGSKITPGKQSAWNCILGVFICLSSKSAGW